MQRQKRSDRLRRDSSIPNIFPFFSQVQELGLQEAYGQDRGTHDFVRRLMALPFLPAEKNQNTISSPTGKSHYRSSEDVHSLYWKYVDYRWHIPTNNVECVHASRANKQRPGSMAQRPQQTRERERPTAPVCIDSAPPQGSIVGGHTNSTSVR